MINLFKSAKDNKAITQIELKDILKNIEIGTYEEIIKNIRKTEDKEKRINLKKSLPAFTVSGLFEKTRKKENLKKHSGYICLDLDPFINGVKNFDDIEFVKNSLKTSEFTYSVFKSASGKGLAWIVRIESNHHERAFDGLRQYLFNTLGILCDETCKDISRLRYVSFDPDIFINQKAKTFKQYVKKETKGKRKTRENEKPPIEDLEKQKERIESLLKRLNKDITGDYHKWLRIGFAIASSFGEEGEKYFLQISKFYPLYDEYKAKRQYRYCLRHYEGSRITLGTFFHYVKEAGIEIYTDEEKETIKKQTFELISQDFENINEKEKLEKIELFKQINSGKEYNIQALAEFVDLVYNPRFNSITREYITNQGSYSRGLFKSICLECKILFPSSTVADISICCERSLGKTFNPIKDYFDSTKWDKKDRIEDLTKTLNCHTIPFELQKTLLKKWLLGLVQNSYYNDPSPLMLVLAGRQRTGKTYWLRNLLPEKLKDYFAEAQHDGTKDDDLLMTKKLLIVDDEFSGKSKKDAKKMKRLLSTDYFDLRPPYEPAPLKLKRICVMAGTCNETEILNDPTGNRRFLPFQIDDQMNWELYNSIDKDQLFAQLKYLFDEGERSNLSIDEITQLNESTQELHYETSLEAELLESYYESSTFESIEHYSNTEIKIYLEKLTNQKLNQRKLGLELKRLGYKQKSIRVGNTVRKLYTISKKSLIEQDFCVTETLQNKTEAIKINKNIQTSIKDKKPFKKEKNYELETKYKLELNQEEFLL